ncbi:MAG TPA: carboxylesterase/lipase family protein [Ktedonobacteraceae bacterium]|nr:carboxylesterase/lipase family protein [Ktedonobacteraceae bacterium]
MSETLVQTQYGKMQGIQEGAVYSWKGIPYAKPPLGELRFRPPQPLEAWSDIRQATQFGPVAMQSPAIEKLAGRRLAMSEDCLTLNIWSPEADEKLRPVLVWIHGGGFEIGSGSFHDGTPLAAMGDVVVVTFNYRLGAFGFLHLAEIGGEAFAGSGNCGLLDQVAALEWVHNNIAVFGGDPQRVTVFGESAGAMSIAVLLALPTAHGLFHRAILQSGAAQTVRSSSDATDLAGIFLKILDVSPQTLSTLKQIQAERLVEAASGLPDWRGTTGAGDTIHFTPVIDGVILPQTPLQTLANGAAINISLVIGTTKDECLFYPFADPTWREADEEVLIQRCKHLVGAAWSYVSPFYLHGQPAGLPLLKRLLSLLTFDHFIFPAIQLAETLVNQGARVWFYRFDWHSPFFDGAAHTLDRLFVWNLVASSAPVVERMTGNAPERLQLAHQMQRSWIAFAHHGDPNTPELPLWPSYDLKARATMLFNRESLIQDDPDAEARQVWANASSLGR